MLLIRKYTTEELQHYVFCNKTLGEPGKLSKVYINLSNPSELIKLDIQAYKLLYEQEPFESFKTSNISINVDQIKRLNYMQEKIHLSTLPLGIVYLHDIPVGIILKHFENYTNLSKKKISSIDELLIIFNTILENLIELEKNNILNEDLHLNNILIKEQNIQLIDLEGPFISFEKENDYRYCQLYIRLLKLFVAMLKNNRPSVIFDQNLQNRINQITESAINFSKNLSTANEHQEFVKHYLRSYEKAIKNY